MLYCEKLRTDPPFKAAFLCILLLVIAGGTHRTRIDKDSETKSDVPVKSRRIKRNFSGLKYIFIGGYAPGKAVTLEVLNPRARILEKAKDSISKRLDSLNGKKIGILDNGKPAASYLRPIIRRYLKAVSQKNIQFRTWIIPLALKQELKEPGLKEMADWSDAVIAGTGTEAPARQELRVTQPE